MDLFPRKYAQFAADYAPGDARAATLARERANWAGPRDYVEREVQNNPISNSHLLKSFPLDCLHCIYMLPPPPTSFAQYISAIIDLKPK